MQEEGRSEQLTARSRCVVAAAGRSVELPPDRLQVVTIATGVEAQGDRGSSTTRTGSAHIALLEYADGVKRYIIAPPAGLKDGEMIGGELGRGPGRAGKPG